MPRPRNSRSSDPPRPDAAALAKAYEPYSIRIHSPGESDVSFVERVYLFEIVHRARPVDFLQIENPNQLQCEYKMGLVLYRILSAAADSQDPSGEDAWVHSVTLANLLTDEFKRRGNGRSWMQSDVYRYISDFRAALVKLPAFNDIAKAAGVDPQTMAETFLLTREKCGYRFVFPPKQINRTYAIDVVPSSAAEQPVTRRHEAAPSKSWEVLDSGPRTIV